MPGIASNMAKAMGLKGAAALGPEGCKARARKAALARWGKVQEEDDNPADLCRRLRACLPPDLSWYDRSLSALASALAAK
jgi:hypothetical protein